jgi:Tol biopolymer transport system component
MYFRRALAPGLLASLGLLTSAAGASAQAALTRVSVDSYGAEADGDSAWNRPAFSSDGRFVAFASYATNLVYGDYNGVADVFVFDRASSVTVRVSIDSAGVEGNGDSYSASISGDGRFVAFTSWANNLVATDTFAFSDVFVHDRDPDVNGIFDEGNGITLRVSVRTNGTQANGNSGNPSISRDGTLVAFDSVASNLVAGDRNGVKDVFVHDWVVAQTTRVSLNSSGGEANDQSFSPAISPDGQVVAFVSSANDLVLADKNGVDDVFVHERATGLTEKASVDSAGNAANNWSAGASLSDDGSIVAFYSWADNLVASDKNGSGDVFVHDRATGVTERVSVDSSGTAANGYSLLPSLSSDGSVVAFESGADNLVAHDVNGFDDVFVHDRTTGATTIASMNGLGAIGDGYSAGPALTSDGRFVAFASYATNLITTDTNLQGDVYVLDRSVNQDASWNNYGAGYPGTLGIPSLTASADPVFGTTINVDVGNSLGLATPGLLFAGLSPASIPTSAGGTLLVNFVLMVPLVVSAGGESLPATIPYDPAFYGVQVCLQVLEADSGAAHKLSFTPGLALIFGR